MKWDEGSQLGDCATGISAGNDLIDEQNGSSCSAPLSCSKMGCHSFSFGFLRNPADECVLTLTTPQPNYARVCIIVDIEHVE